MLILMSPIFNDVVDVVSQLSLGVSASLYVDVSMSFISPL